MAVTGYESQAQIDDDIKKEENAIVSTKKRRKLIIHSVSGEVYSQALHRIGDNE